MTQLAAILLVAGSLYDQSLIRLLRERFSGPGISYLFLDARSGGLLDSRWPDAERPVAVGSLVKPFTALAYGEAHQFHYPDFVCHGKANRCWLERGHGRIGIVEAVAQSCNAYFRGLAAEVRPADLAGVVQRYGVDGPPAGATVETLIGLGRGWEMAPLALAGAYCRLIAEPRAAELVRGMALAAQSGTARAAGLGLVKTGTAPCAHVPKAPGDGYAMAFYPAEAPRYALLVRVHGVPGAEAARVAGKMLRVLRDGR
ncbi:MAG: penicillin-binding transpeptidase domain-containing protein [Bryobacteraceae bacterium]